jgi:hypothetical protein
MIMEITNENLVDAFRKSGRTQIEFCREHDIEIEKLRYYLYKKGKQAARKNSKGQKHTPSASFISFDSPGPLRIDKLSATIIHGRFTLTEISNLIHSLAAANA